MMAVQFVRAAIRLPISVLCLAGLLFGCEGANSIHGNGRSATELRALMDFSQIEVDGAAELEITIGTPPRVELLGDENLLGLISTQVDDGKLTIQPQQSLRPSMPLRIRVVAPSVERIAAAGATGVRFDRVAGDEFWIECHGASSAVLSGRADRLQVRAWEGSTVDANEVEARDVEAKLAGAAQVEVHANQQLSVQLTGASSLTYSGSPKVTKNLATAGSLRQKKPATRPSEK